MANNDRINLLGFLTIVLLGWVFSSSAYGVLDYGSILHQADRSVFARHLNSGVGLDQVLPRLESEEYGFLVQWLKFSTPVLSNNVSYTFEQIFGFYLRYLRYFKEGAMPRSDVIIWNAMVSGFSQRETDLGQLVNFLIISKNYNVTKFIEKNKLNAQGFKKYIVTEGKAALDRVARFRQLALERDAYQKAGDGRVSKKDLRDLGNLDKKGRYSGVLLQRYCQTGLRKYLQQLGGSVNVGHVVSSPYVLYSCMFHVAKKGKYKQLVAILRNAQPDVVVSLKYAIWKDILNPLVRDLVKRGSYQTAYDILSVNIFPKNTFQYRLCEFMAGFVAMKYLDGYSVARDHFEKMYYNSNQNVYSLSKSAFFLFRVYSKLGQHREANKWLKLGSHHPKTFYGQVAIDVLNGVDPVLFLGTEGRSMDRIRGALSKKGEVMRRYLDALFLVLSRYKVDATHTFLELKSSLFVRVGIAFLDLDMAQEGYMFLKKAIDHNLTESQVSLLFKVIQHNKNAEMLYFQFSGGLDNTDIPFLELYKTVPHIIKTHNYLDRNLLHAIVKKESSFIVQAKGDAGELGLMQLMPNTGLSMARQMRVDVGANGVQHPRVNIKLGSHYMKKLNKRYRYRYPLSIAAYNAGPTNVNLWIERYGDIKTIGDMVDFIELIPFGTTRNYVKRVMEMEALYSYLIDQVPSDKHLKLDI